MSRRAVSMAPLVSSSGGIFANYRAQASRFFSRLTISLRLRQSATEWRFSKEANSSVSSGLAISASSNCAISIWKLLANKPLGHGLKECPHDPRQGPVGAEEGRPHRTPLSQRIRVRHYFASGAARDLLLFVARRWSAVSPGRHAVFLVLAGRNWFLHILAIRNSQLPADDPRIAANGNA